MADIVTALDGPATAESAGPSSDARGSDAATDQVVRAAWKQVNAAIADALGHITLDALVEQRQRHDNTAMFQI
jgi:DNA-binding IscR family transcriptional regulator